MVPTMPVTGAKAVETSAAVGLKTSTEIVKAARMTASPAKTTQTPYLARYKLALSASTCGVFRNRKACVKRSAASTYNAALARWQMERPSCQVRVLLCAKRGTGASHGSGAADDSRIPHRWRNPGQPHSGPPTAEARPAVPMRGRAAAQPGGCPSGAAASSPRRSRIARCGPRAGRPTDRPSSLCCDPARRSSRRCRRTRRRTG